MSILTIGTVLVISFIVTALCGAKWAFVWVFIPAMILLNQLPEIAIPHAPLSIQSAALYGIFFALPLRNDSLRFRICSVDVIFLLLLFSAVITGWTTEVFETGINTLRTDFLWLTAPYLLARISFKDWHVRRGALIMFIILLAIISVAALIEFRLTPYFYMHMLEKIGMHNKVPIQSYMRWSFFRVAGPVDHPIYFGNMCVVILGMVAVLARTSGVSLKNPWVATALFAAFGCVMTSISFTPYAGMIAGTVCLLSLIFLKFTRYLVLPITLVAIMGIAGYTYKVAHEPLGEKPEPSPDTQVEGSLYTRKMIISQAWKKAEIAGPFGLGIRVDFSESDDSEFDLKSVDNSYLQFTMTHGWVYTALWISIAVFFSFRMTMAFRAVRDPSQVFPLAVCTATVLALMVSMYTVWAGALYTVVWAIMLGLSNTLIDSVREAAKGVPLNSSKKSSAPPRVYRPVNQGYAPTFASGAGLRIAES